MKKTLALLLTLCLLIASSSAFAYELREPIGEYPLTTEDITLTILMPQDTLVEDYETNAFTKWIEDTTGVKLDFELLPANSAVTRIRLPFAHQITKGSTSASA